MKWLKSLSEEELELGRRIELARAREDYKRLKDYLGMGLCSLCEKPLATFKADRPCLHWLLRPKGFKKRYFPDLFRGFSYFRMSAYVRWVASTEAPGKNVNDLVAEHPGGKIVDFTARYKHITWSFSCATSDLKGHGATNFPHYHFQMTLESKRFISYNDFHIPFSTDDLYDLELFTNHGDFVKHSYGPGFGMQQLLGDRQALECVVQDSIPTTDEASAAFEMSTLVTARDGEKLSGAEIYEAIQEAKRSGRTIAAVMRERFPNAGMTTIVSPGEGVVDPKQRTRR